MVVGEIEASQSTISNRITTRHDATTLVHERANK